ncbi:LOB domain-containing protein 15-like [Eucalyptus grandis]|uniref:LOB domain-containing protein 15-like n=1 Tax=Eucalyptus grandis TaxID=71139 RepID=UPI00192EF79B|nr:LOB domain-containing protein 15-like [Eucalyptus grandis]
MHYHVHVIIDTLGEKLFQKLPLDQRAAAVESMVYEANTRERDPIRGCYGEITTLKELVDLHSMKTPPLRCRLIYGTRALPSSSHANPLGGWDGQLYRPPWPAPLHLTMLATHPVTPQNL